MAIRLGHNDSTITPVGYYYTQTFGAKLYELKKEICISEQLWLILRRQGTRKFHSNNNWIPKRVNSTRTNTKMSKKQHEKKHSLKKLNVVKKLKVTFKSVPFVKYNTLKTKKYQVKFTTKLNISIYNKAEKITFVVSQCWTIKNCWKVINYSQNFINSIKGGFDVIIKRVINGISSAEYKLQWFMK